MIKKPMSEYPKRDLTPEHTKRGSEDHGSNNDGQLNQEIEAAFDYVNSVSDTSDYKPDFAWHGWAIREAFLAGISYAHKRGANGSQRQPSENSHAVC